MKNLRAADVPSVPWVPIKQVRLSAIRLGQERIHRRARPEARGFDWKRRRDPNKPAAALLALASPREQPVFTARVRALCVTMNKNQDLPTPRSTLKDRYVRALLTCSYCKHQADVDLRA